jgi:hypothetical protein
MTASEKTEGNVADELLRLEQERCRALSEKDWPALEHLIAKDYTHGHSTGTFEDRPTYLEGVKARPRRTSRRDLKVHVYGEAAIINGPMTVNLEAADGTTTVLEAVSTGTWVREAGDWKLAALQVTRVSA